MRRKKIVKLKGWLAVLAGSLGLGVMVFFARNLFLGPAEVAINQAKPELPVELISDKFSGNLKGFWAKGEPAGSTATVVSGRLRLFIPADSADHWAAANSQTDIAPGKDFSVTVTMFEPSVTGSGRGESNLIVQKNQEPWTWRANIGWYKLAGQKDSFLYFSDEAGYGSAEKKVTVLPERASVIVKLSRQGNKYIAQYLIAGLKEWKKLGDFEAEITDTLHAVLVVRQLFTPVPQVTGFFDNFSLRIEK